LIAPSFPCGLNEYKGESPEWHAEDSEKMTASPIGIDISKNHLDAYRMSDGASRRFANDKAGHKVLIKWLSQTPVERVVFEPTGPYRRAFEQARGERASLLPRATRVRPAVSPKPPESSASTDRLDAALLARMGAVLAIEPRFARAPALAKLRELHSARQALIKTASPLRIAPKL